MERCCLQTMHMEFWTNRFNPMHVRPAKRSGRRVGRVDGLVAARNRFVHEVTTALSGGDRHDARPGTLDVARNDRARAVRVGIVVPGHLRDVDVAGRVPGSDRGPRCQRSADRRRSAPPTSPRAGAHDHAHGRRHRPLPAGNLHRAASPADQRRCRRPARLSHRAGGERQLPYRIATAMPCCC